MNAVSHRADALVAPRLGVGSGCVLAGEFTSVGGEPFWETLARAPCGRRDLIVLDLGRRAAVVAPGTDECETRVVVIGELDIATAAELSGALSFALDRRPAHVVLDLRWLAFIDAHSARTIARESARMEGWDGALSLLGTRHAVRRVLDLCGFGALLTEGIGRSTEPAAG